MSMDLESEILYFLRKRKTASTWIFNHEFRFKHRLTTKEWLKRLKIMEAYGLVERDKNLSTSNNYVWRLPGKEF